jgi:general secretion pathway protein I
MNKQNGFTLLEVLVAFTMLAVTFGTVMQIIAGSSKNTVKASQNTKIAMLSQSKLDELGLLEVIEEGSTSGYFDDNTSWILEIIPYEAPYEGDFNQDFSAIDLMEVKLIVINEQGNNQHVTEFNTLRAVTPDFSSTR